MKKLIIFIGLIILIAFIGIGAFFVARHLAYNRVERLTRLYAHEFSTVMQRMSSQYALLTEESIEYYKVFSYEPDQAELFVVFRLEDGNRHGVYVYVERASEEWQITQSELIWARYGSADNRTWPPYW